MSLSLGRCDDYGTTIDRTPPPLHFFPFLFSAPPLPLPLPKEMAPASLARLALLRTALEERWSISPALSSMPPPAASPLSSQDDDR